MLQARPINCKLADFGESRSAINETSNVCLMVTSNIIKEYYMQYLTFLFSDFARLEFVAGQQFVRFQEAPFN